MTRAGADEPNQDPAAGRRLRKTGAIREMQDRMNSGNLPPVVVVQQGEVNVHDSPDPDEPDPDEYSWMHDARCRGVNPTEFFPSDGMGVEAAQRVCEGCTVRVVCLEYALANRIEHGVWGGASERERRRILRRRRELSPSTHT